VDLICYARPSDSPLVETVWHSQSEEAVPFISMADRHWEIVVTKHEGKTFLTVRGPETRATPAHGLIGAEFVGIQFKAGAFMPNLPTKMVMDRRDLNLPEATGKSFWLNGSVWQYPNYENADTFVDWLVRDGLLVYDPIVETVLQGQPVEMSLRTVQRRFLRTTALTHNTIYQIERARYATSLIKQGASIPDVAYQAGYFDQPHLTRSLKHYIGLTPSQIKNQNRSERLSFLYKTDRIYPFMMNMSDTRQKENGYAEYNRIRVFDPGRRHRSTRGAFFPVSE
jgi:AraC-like DNA-binding protein